MLQLSLAAWFNRWCLNCISPFKAWWNRSYSLLWWLFEIYKLSIPRKCHLRKLRNFYNKNQRNYASGRKTLLLWIHNPALSLSLLQGSLLVILPQVDPNTVRSSFGWRVVFVSAVSRVLWGKFFLLFSFSFIMGKASFLIQWNIRSIRANGHWLRSSLTLQSSILCLQETFLTPSDTVHFPGLVCYRADRLSSRGGGLLTAVHTSFASYMVSLPTCPTQDFEALGVMVNLDGSWTLVLNCYSPSGSFPGDWLSALLQAWDYPCILVGDFNINILCRSPSSSSKAQALFDWINSQALCLMNTNHPTRECFNSSPSLLDLTIISPSLYSKFMFYVHPDLYDSDHHPILLIRQNSHTSQGPSRYKQWTKVSAALNSLNNPIAQSYEEFEKICSQIASSNLCEHRASIPSNRPWWDSTCTYLLTLKRKHLRLARSLCSKEQWMLYKKYASKLRRHIKQSSRRFWDNLCRDSCSSGKIFKLLKRLANRELPYGDNIIRTPSPAATVYAEAQAFLAYFQKSDPPIPVPYDLSGGNSSLDAPFTFEELCHALSHSRPTTPGADGIPVRLFQSLSEFHRNSLLEWFNLIYDSGVLPDSWTLATIVPIRKPGKTSTDVSSYRPIALTSTGCKIMERMIHRRLLTWLGQQNLLHPEQFGFIPGRDCTLALCTLMHDIRLARSRNWFIAAICLDLKAAYDSVWLDNLTYKLASYGVGGTMGRWIASFVKSRRIQIRWKTYISQQAPSNQGVPQGSVLSPLLFIIYILDIVETLEEGVRMVIYADDIVVYASGSNETRTRQKLHDTLSRIHKWCTANKLTLSPEKCAAINFSRSRDPGDPIKLMGFEVPWSPSVKILGICLSRSLSFTSHFKALKIKVMRRLNYVKAVAGRSRGISSYHLLRIIHSLVRSCLEYGAPLFFDSPTSSIQILEVCYNAAIRMATGLPKWTPIPVLLREAGVSNIRSRLSLLTKLFLLRLLSSSPNLRLGSIAKSAVCSPSSDWKWASPLQELSDEVNGPLTNLISFTWPPPPCSLHYRVLTHGLPFQDTSLPPSAVTSSWHLWRASLPSCILIATDASKDVNKTAVAAVDADTGVFSAFLVSNLNSIFTAEALAIHTALTHLPLRSRDIVILSDSLSVLRALKSWSFKSPKIILMLLTTINNCNSLGHTITFVWVPGHRGIAPNERADYLASNGPFSCYAIPWISPEDLRYKIKTNWIIENEYTWINCDYANSFLHLTSNRSFPSWTRNRKDDVLLARWRSKTLVTHQHLYRMGQSFSPLCRRCFDLETPDHILLRCPGLVIPRNNLLNSLGVPRTASYDEIMETAFASRRGLASLLCFSNFALSDRA